ncbi:MAG: flagellar export chaperone FliS [Myxococcota bacterium]
MQISVHAAHAAYQNGQVSSAEPLRIIVLLYEGALRFGRQALEHFADPASRGQALGRAHAIVAELLASLDHDRGEAIAGNLDALYAYILDALTAANVRGDRRALESVLGLLDTLLDAWRTIEQHGGRGSDPA